MKNKKNNKGKKSTTILLIAIIMFVLFLGALVYLYLNTEDRESNLTILEKQWIENNKSVLIDVEIVNNMDIIGKEGNGVAFDFLKGFESTTGLEFNKISYEYPSNPTKNKLSIKVINNSEKLESNDLILLEDNYLLIGNKKEDIDSVYDLTGKTIGILENDASLVSKFLTKVTNVSVKNYKSIDNLITAFDKNEINNMIVPNFIYLSYVSYLEEKYVNYQINDIYNTIVLHLGDNTRLNNILSKYHENWTLGEQYKSYNNQIFNYFVNSNSVLDKDKSELGARVFKYGYVEDLPYNIVINGKLYGIAGEYINMLSSMSNIEFKYVKYNSVKSLKSALDKGEVDLTFITFPYNTNSYLKTSSHFEEKVVGLSNKYLNVSSLDNLGNYKIYSQKDNYIYETLKGSKYNLKAVDQYSDQYKNGILVLDKYQYLYNSDKGLKNANIIFSDNIKGDYTFAVKSNNDLLYQLLNFITDYGYHNYYKIRALNNVNNVTVDTNNFTFIIKIIVGVFLIPLILILIFSGINRKQKEKKTVKKEDVLKYNDMLTSLKNRNYLNKNMKEWSEANIYPRAVVIADLNNLKYVNDNYGYEAGNDLIVQAASILINTQLEKSEIIRSDGNEFLIYLIGYTDKQISTYVNKLQKEFDKLPYGFGAAIGYSMITDEIKTIDDAINEATIEMRTNKEQDLSK